MTDKPTKPYDWNPFVKHGAKVLNEEAGVTSPASAAKNKKPYYVSINGNLTDVNDPEWVARASNSPRDTIQTAVTESAKPKIVEGQIGTVKYVGNRNIGNEFSRNPNDYKTPKTKESWDQKLKIDPDTKRHVMKEQYESNKYKRPMSGSGTILRSIIEDDAKAKIAKLKSTKPVQIDFSNNSALQDLEEFHQSRIEADARARRYHEIIKKRDDPSLHKGLAAILGSIPQDFNK